MSRLQHIFKRLRKSSEGLRQTKGQPSPRSAFRIGSYTLASLSFTAVAWNATELSEPTNLLSSSSSLSQTSTLTLIRSYLVWSTLSFPTLVDTSPTIFNFLLNSRIPLVPSLTEIIVKATFFPQFIPGETALECLPALEALRRRNVGSALNYSAEADAVEQMDIRDGEELRFKEIQRAIDVQGEFEKRMHLEGWAPGSSAFAVKVSGIIDPGVLRRASDALQGSRANIPNSLGEEVSYPGFPSETDSEILVPSLKTWSDVISSFPSLSQGDLEQLKTLWNRLDCLAAQARTNGVRLILDAEETWLNPAIDGYTLLLSMKHNKRDPVVYGTYQSYLQRQPAFLRAWLDHAQLNDYCLGLKLVRGGYIVKEKAHGEKQGKPGNGAVWATKDLTDTSYNSSVDTILEALRAQLDRPEKTLPLGIIFGTHNMDSVQTVLRTLEAKGLATRTAAGTLRMNNNAKGKVNIAQLYGMREDLSDVVCAAFEPSRSAISMKFIAYGTLRETMPFLSRRATENKSIMSGPTGAAAERRRVGAELRSRLSFGLL
ncbi:hypothetical protein I302_105760 [Kwoniella bestiolae CBS 10118]|uniref:Proline dehydrogenase n=1 Tax=Kwoniella bestiolae CBS 10118 TaxID=1296100 RepID=A0A1B9G218_9TREE|nr:hypothetical protein I302_04882 [Kwoniella bestiolae CBS 10118]OCF25072.1 hypothetical protein I302_04882 [Kwoniella bestiolae CBS 10118]